MGREGNNGKKRKRRERKGKERKGREGKGRKEGREDLNITMYDAHGVNVRQRGQQLVWGEKMGEGGGGVVTT
jgi:hypothetical protein